MIKIVAKLWNFPYIFSYALLWIIQPLRISYTAIHRSYWAIFKLRRFITRRGLIMQKNILWYETNFIDIRNKWHKLDVLLKNKEHNTKILDMLGKKWYNSAWIFRMCYILMNCGKIQCLPNITNHLRLIIDK